MILKRTVPSAVACMAGAKRGGGAGRKKSVKVGKREESACYNSWCFCILPSIFSTYLIMSSVNTIDQSQVGGISAWSELNYFVYRKLSSRDAFFNLMIS